MALVTGAASYTWTITGDATVQSQTTTASGTTATVLFGASWTSGTINCVVANACGSVTRSGALRSTPLQPGSINGPGFGLCNSSNVTYSIDPVPTATSYSWTVPAGATIQSNSGTSITVNFGPAFTGSGNICVSANNGCGAGVSRCYTVSARPAVPVITGPSAVCKSSTQTYTISNAPIASATSYSWSVIGGASITPLGTTASVNFNTSSSSSATVRAAANNACGQGSPFNYAVTVNTGCRSSVEDAVASTFTAYPNPTSGRTNISFTSEDNAKFTLRVTDLLGNVLVSETVNAEAGYNMKEVNLSGVTKGLYLVNLTSDNGSIQTLRLVVE